MSGNFHKALALILLPAIASCASGSIEAGRTTTYTGHNQFRLTGTASRQAGHRNQSLNFGNQQVQGGTSGEGREVRHLGSFVWYELIVGVGGGAGTPLKTTLETVLQNWTSSRVGVEMEAK